MTKFSKCPVCARRGWSKTFLACRLCGFKVDKAKGPEICRYGSSAK